MTNTDSKLFKPCTRCNAAEAIWQIRAKTQFVCEKCKRGIEWEQGDETHTS